jgi:hypothetical protein
MESPHNTRQAAADRRFSAWPPLRLRCKAVRNWTEEPEECCSQARMLTTTMTSVQKLLTRKEVAEWLDVSVDWVHNHATRKTPRLPVVRIRSANEQR